MVAFKLGSTISTRPTFADFFLHEKFVVKSWKTLKSSWEGIDSKLIFWESPSSPLLACLLVTLKSWAEGALLCFALTRGRPASITSLLPLVWQILSFISKNSQKSGNFQTKDATTVLTTENRVSKNGPNVDKCWKHDRISMRIHSFEIHLWISFVLFYILTMLLSVWD